MATVVLVHGTTAGGWVWRRITPVLATKRHLVYTPTLTGLGERVHLARPDVDLETHIADIMNVLEFEELPAVTLVGHSYGGMVITGVADRLPGRVSKLIYLDALVPEDGEAVVDLVGPHVRADTERQVQAEGEGWLIPAAFAAIDRPTFNRPHPYASWTQPLRLRHPEALAAIPRVYVRYTADKQEGAYFNLAMERSWRRVREAGWKTREVNTIHQIVPDPEPKAASLAELLDEGVLKLPVR
jgi:pimeloyl-ACP methyl ester carboxylesterase